MSLPTLPVLPTRTALVDSNSAADINAIVTAIGDTVTVISDHGFIPISQCAISGAVDASGYANFLSEATTDNVTLAATTTPLIVAFANGFDAYGEKNIIAQISADVTPAAWTGLTTDGTYYLWVDISGTTVTYGKTNTLVTPDYVEAKAAAGTATKHSYVIPERKMYVDSGAAWTAVTRVFLGEVVVSGSHVTSVITYALKARYISPKTALPVAGSSTLNHYIGCEKLLRDAVIICKTAEHGFAINDQRGLIISGGTGIDADGGIIEFERLSCFLIHAAGTNYLLRRKSDGVAQALTTANWEYQVILRRAF